MIAPSLLRRGVRRVLASALPRFRGQDGLTVAEMAVAVALMMIAVAATGSVLMNDLFRVSQVEAESNAVTEVRAALGRIERDIRSADCIYEPLPAAAGAAATGSRLEMDTRAGGTNRRVIYDVNTSGQLTFTDVTGGGAPTVLYKGFDLGARANTFEHTAPNAYANNPSEPQYSRIRVTLVRDVEDVNHSTERRLDTVVTARNADVLASTGTGNPTCAVP